MVVLARALQVLFALLMAYGATAMFSTAGFQPPNPLVWVGLAGQIAMALAAGRVHGNYASGWWLSLACIALPFLVLSLPSGGDPCPPGHPPITPDYTCAVPVPTLVFVSSLIGSVIAALGAANSLRREWLPGSRQLGN